MFLKLIPDGDKKQQLRVNRILQAIGSALLQSIVAVILFFAGGFRLSGIDFLALLASLWVGHIVFYLLIRTGFNRRFSDPSLTQAQVIWGIFCTLIILYFMADFRLLILPFLLLILIFGAFKMTTRQYITIAVLIVVGYFAVMGLVYSSHPETIRPKDEIIGALVFMLTILAFSLVGNEISRLRSKLRRRNAKLAETMQQVEQMASTDELTGLINRREMMLLLKRQKARSDRGKNGFSVCFFDIDHFKTVNDTFGHHIGDVVLKRFASETMKVIRDADLFARFGGEEFLLLAADSDLEGAAVVTERIRSTVADIDFSDVATGLSVTVSAGIARFRPKEEIRSILTRSDKALYLAKNSGRNCIRLESDI
ncbi:GGDEF domain-containing protein [Desulfospira joergensenii]|uniref:GGDEF domain-containing protein n=1 Tax=Desulfospira joergensenii TaxID=53329 RepID=UPI0003B676D7|nr:GGDEF domain-containing protein [Desulfospira joergensenii]